MTEITEKIDAVSIERVKDRTVITYKKSKIIGSASSADVLNSVLIAARMQAEKYIERLAKGETLTDKEVMSLAQLANIAKIPVLQDMEMTPAQTTTAVEVLKQNIYARLTEKMGEKPK